MAAANNSLTGPLSQLEDTLSEYLIKKAPFTLPKNIKEIIVSITPWITLIGCVILIPIVLGGLGLTAILAPLAMLGGGYSAGGNMISMAVLAVAVVLEAMAVPGLFKKSKSAWNLLFYAMLIQVVADLVSFDIVGGIVRALIGLYILFQVREYYK